MKINELMEYHKIVDGDFNNLEKFDFCGVYILYKQDENDATNEDVVYVGSAYSRKVKDRLAQYKEKNDTGNTLLHAICKKEFNVQKVKEITDDNKDKAINIILKLKIKAIIHEDLEYQLIRRANPIYNKAGNAISNEQ